MDSSEDSSLMKPHVLKPCVTLTSINGGSVPPPRSRQRFFVSSSDYEVLSSKITLSGFAQRPDFNSWAVKMEALHASTWKKAGIFEAVKASTYKISSNPSLILALVEKWCPETKSFIFPLGEATITLEDVMVLLGFSVLGSPVFTPLESSEMKEAVEKLEIGRVEHLGRDSRVRLGLWVSGFEGRDDQIEHDAFLAMWLSLFVFPIAYRCSISKDVFPIAVCLARGDKIALAPAVLASLYRDLDRICAFARDDSIRRVSLKSLFKLVQVWIWERFRSIGQESKPLRKDEPRIARWSCVNISYNRLSFNGFEWRPYCQPLENWNCSRFYLEEGKWMTVDDSLDDEFVSFVRCLRVSQLVGIGFVEDYYPHRVAMQFGLAQDLPGLVTDHCNFTEKEAWEDYVKPLDGLKLYVSSRLATASVTKRYQDWWLKSVSKFLSSEESTESFNASNTVVVAADDDDVPLAKLKWSKKRGTTKYVRSDIKQGERRDCGGSRLREMPLSEMFHQELAKRTSELPRNKRAHESCSDHNITIAKITKSKKKVRGSNAEKIGNLKQVPLSKLFHKELAKGTSETVVRNITIDELIQSRKKTGGYTPVSIRKGSKIAEKRKVLIPSTVNNSSDPNRGIAETIVSPPEKRQNHDDEINVNGSNAEKKALTDDATKGEGRLLHGNGEKLCSEAKKSNDDDERWRQRKIAIEELAMNLEARMMKVEQTLTIIRKCKTSRSQIQTGVSA